MYVIKYNIVSIRIIYTFICVNLVLKRHIYTNLGKTRINYLFIRSNNLTSGSTCHISNVMFQLRQTLGAEKGATENITRAISNALLVAI